MLDQLLYANAAQAQRNAEVNELLKAQRALRAMKKGAANRETWVERLLQPVWTVLRLAFD